jgi:hypothetical protein
MTEKEKQGLRIMITEQRRICERKNARHRKADPKHGDALDRCPRCGAPVLIKKYKGELEPHVLEHVEPTILSNGLVNYWRYHHCEIKEER